MEPRGDHLRMRDKRPVGTHWSIKVTFSNILLLSPGPFLMIKRNEA